MAVAGSSRQQAPTRRAEVGAFGRLAALAGAGPCPAADVLELLCTEVRSAFGYERAAVLHHNTGTGMVLPVVRQRLDWPDHPLQVAKLPFVAEALARREAVASRGGAAGLELPRLPCLCSSPAAAPRSSWPTGRRTRRTTRHSSC